MYTRPPDDGIEVIIQIISLHPPRNSGPGFRALRLQGTITKPWLSIVFGPDCWKCGLELICCVLSAVSEMTKAGMNSDYLEASRNSRREKPLYHFYVFIILCKTCFKRNRDDNVILSRTSRGEWEQIIIDACSRQVQLSGGWCFV